MALADFTEDKPPSSGWRLQAQRLAGAHSAFGMKAIAAAGQARQQRDTGASAGLTDRAATAEVRQADLARNLEHALAQICGLEQRIADEKAARDEATRQLETLQDQNNKTAGRIAALEAELAAARNTRGLQQSEAESLRNSLDLAISENSRMAARVDLAESLLAESRVQTESFRAEAVTADVERIKTVDVAHRVDEKRQAETRQLQDELTAMTLRARTAETLLADARECLVLRITESEKLACSLVEATDANCDADRRLAELQDLLRARELQIAEIEQSRQTLMTKANKLLENYQSRDHALARAEEKIKQLDQWIVRLEAEALRSRDEKRNAVAAVVPAKTEIRAAAEDPREARRKKWMELARELAKLDLKRQVPGPDRDASTPALLTGTIRY